MTEDPADKAVERLGVGIACRRRWPFARAAQLAADNDNGQNWGSSNGNNGTPGVQNSINSTNLGPADRQCRSVGSGAEHDDRGDDHGGR